MACDDCERHDWRTSPERLNERLTRLELKTHPGDALAVLLLVALVSWALVKLMEKAGVSLDG